MPAEATSIRVVEPALLTSEQAAAHIGFTSKTFDKWIQQGLLPPGHSNTGGWTKEALDEALNRLCRYGYQPDNQQSKKSGYIALPNVHRTFITKVDEIKSWHYRRRGLRGPIYGEPGGPQFMKGLIAKEREFASRHQNDFQKSIRTVATDFRIPLAPNKERTEPSPVGESHRRS